MAFILSIGMLAPLFVPAQNERDMVLSLSHQISGKTHLISSGNRIVFKLMSDSRRRTGIISRIKPDTLFVDDQAFLIADIKVLKIRNSPISRTFLKGLGIATSMGGGALSFLFYWIDFEFNFGQQILPGAMIVLGAIALLQGNKHYKLSKSYKAEVISLPISKIKYPRRLLP